MGAGPSDPDIPGTPRDPEAFLAAFAEWVEACWFDERTATGPRLDAVLAFPPEVVLAGSLGLLARLAEAAGSDRDVIAAALAEHLIVTGPDAPRRALIRAVVLAAGAPAADRRRLLGGHDPQAVAGAALECASFLAQVLAERDGVVPSSVVRDV
jgi:hypothetical protein